MLGDFNKPTVKGSDPDSTEGSHPWSVCISIIQSGMNPGAAVKEFFKCN